MALQMAFTDPYGRENAQSYWYWTGLSVDAITGNCVITLYGYTNAEAADAGKEPIGMRQIKVSGEAFGQLVQTIGPTITPAVYDRAKADDFFKTATQV